jgi:anti-anti-sigma factor
MPKLLCHIRSHALGGEGGPQITELVVDGFIDAANYLTFEKALEESCGRQARALLVDFSRVHYINSTGISALIRYSERLRGRSGLLCLAAVSRPVGLSMHLLGVTSLIPFLRDVAAAKDHLAAFLSGKSASGQPEGIAYATGIDEPAQNQVTPGRRGRAVPTEPVRAPSAGRTPSRTPSPGRVLVITPSRTRFTRVLRLRFEHLDGDYHLLHDPKEALDRYEEIDPDIVVLDERCDPRGEFVSRVKVQKGRSLTSIIKIYGRDRTILGVRDFKIWENDFLVDPFDILELFSLAEAELLRVPRDRKVFSQQVHFEFRTTPENVEKAYKLSELVIRHSMPAGEEQTAFYAAVKEGIDNAVVHGNLSAAEKTVDVNFLVDHTKVTVIVEDQGNGFDFQYYLSRLNRGDAFEEAKKRIVEENMRGGLGILLMSRCTDRIQYSGPGNVLRLEKNL